MIRVVLVDDQTLVRQGVRGLLGLSDAVDVVAEGADGDEALALVAEHRPDVLLLDLQMPRRDGIATLEALRDAGDPTPVLVLTTFDDDALVARALGAGAHGYLLKDVTLEQLVDAVRRVAAGERLWQPAVTDRLLRALLDRPVVVDGLDRPEPLTARELDVLRLLAAGWSNREIADTLHLAPGTVKNHVSAVLLKLGVRDRTRAVLRALDLGLLGS
ncbi:response regulator [Cellulomonas sp. 179-A 9B4 NHS]|uniref:response regulator n=1 Tax=Cellulomonas sp. 179-A 9B4 NHS TaxID=3142379 RepID=UPI0039A030E1